MNNLSKTNQLKKLSPVFLTIGALLFAASSIFAQQLNLQNQSVQGPDGMGLTYSPPLFEIRLDPGESPYQDFIKIQNTSDDTETYYPKVFDVIPDPETGSPNFVDPLESDSSYSLAQWITLPDEPIVLEPRENSVKTFTISVPEDAEPGGKYAAIFFSTEPEEADADSTGAIVRTRTGPILLVRVNGDVDETAVVQEFSSDSNFYEYPPVNFFASIQNTGNVHVQPFGQITIKDMFGKTVDNVPVMNSLSNILPGSARQFEVAWDPEGFTIGKYEAVLNLTYGTDTQKTLIDVVEFWVVPWKVLALILLGLILTGALIRYGLRKYNEYVLQRALENQRPVGEQEDSKGDPESNDEEREE